MSDPTGALPSSHPSPDPEPPSRRALRARPKRRNRRRSWAWWSIGVIIVLLAGSGIAVWVSFPLSADAAAKEAVADLDGISFDSTVWKDPDRSHDLFLRVVKGLGEPMRTSATVELTGVDATGPTATAHLTWTWPAPGAAGADPTAGATASATDAATTDTTTSAKDEATSAKGEATSAKDGAGDAWTYTSELPLRRNGLFWWAQLTESAIQPDLASGGVLTARANPGKRGSILGADGEALTSEGDVVAIGVHPARLEPDTLPKLVTALNAKDSALDIDEKALEKKVDAVDKDQLVPVVTLRRADYDKVRDDIHSLPGVLFDERTQTLTRKKGFAQALLGTAGPATAEEIDKSDGAISEGAVIGKSGLQEALNTQLGGPANVEVFADGAKDGKLVSLHAFDQEDGADVETTIDVRIQEAADAAVATAKKPAALVAIRPSDGHVLAVANHDPAGAGWDRGLTGQYPPGSVFKIASGLALLENGVTPETTIDCPRTTTVDGKTFKNAEDHVLGSATFAEDFAQSCNTAFVDSATKVSGTDVANAARNLGMSDFDLGVGAKAASIPDDDDPVVHAAQMIGQGKVVASPVAVATMAASVAHANTVSPILVLPDNRTDPEEQILDRDGAKQLQELMRKVVTDGTASALKSVPGEPVHGKTGTAEYGTDDPPRTHSWFAGYQGDLAIAVIVEDGGFGAEAAVPLAGDFFRAVAK